MLSLFTPRLRMLLLENESLVAVLLAQGAAGASCRHVLNPVLTSSTSVALFPNIEFASQAAALLSLFFVSFARSLVVVSRKPGPERAP